ncbi:PREDICTED: ankyrin repeat and SOCS box protein 18 [Ficedula albicollis]|uniref:ankyrin repeat and SOCS box protein 18 n=1 Tax=Ficedula albicollis TaxID=59894 RepID=UPI0007AD7AA3|nr:PREDICTED: ankyrin repeat and SOCS box protein 18 [Ficedula albicollis]
METMDYKSLAIPPGRTCTLGSTGMGESPAAVTAKLRISSKLDPEHPSAPRAPIARFYTALVKGDLRSLQVLTERYHQDVNLVFEISRNELEWQVKSQASYGLSGLWALEERQELSTPLCLAARHGHPECLRHLLRRGADPNLAPGGQGPLHEACRGGHSHCVELLLEYKANPNLRSEEGLAPLHLCASPGSLRCARLLLRRGAAVDLPSEAGGDTALHVAARHRLWHHPDGVSPLGWALHGAAGHRELRPHLTVQLLLNHGSQRIWPHAFAKVLKSCAAVPEVIEVLFNSYSQIPVCQEWAKAVPQEVFQQHRVFYESLRGLAGTARCLQHWCRSALRSSLGSRCHSLVPLLPLPRALQGFLLLEPQGVVL